MAVGRGKGNKTLENSLDSTFSNTISEIAIYIIYFLTTSAENLSPNGSVAIHSLTTQFRQHKKSLFRHLALFHPFYLKTVAITPLLGAVIFAFRAND